MRLRPGPCRTAARRSGQGAADGRSTSGAAAPRRQPGSATTPSPGTIVSVGAPAPCVRTRGFEPLPPKGPGPKPGASTVPPRPRVPAPLWTSGASLRRDVGGFGLRGYASWPCRHPTTGDLKALGSDVGLRAHPAAPARAHRLPRLGRGPAVVEHDLRPAAALGGRGPRPRHQPLHQLARRLGHRRPRHLRHHAVRRLRRADDLPRDGGLDGAVPALRGGAGQALRAAALPDPHAPAAHGHHAGPGLGHRDPGRADRLHEAACWPSASPSTPARPIERDRGGLGPRPLVHGRGGQGVRLHRRGDRSPHRAGRQRTRRS